MWRLFGFGSPDEIEPFEPDEADDHRYRQSARSVDSSLLSTRLVPQWVRRRAISLSITTPQTEYSVESDVPFAVTMENALPLPVTIRTRSPILWHWTVDGLAEASYIDQYDPPDEPGKLHFERGERKRFTGRWPGNFRTSKREWEPAAPGEYSLGAGINVGGADGERLSDEITIRLREE